MSVSGAFLIPYMIMIALIGMPLLFMEYSFGQYFGVGSLSIFKKVCPMFQGKSVYTYTLWVGGLGDCHLYPILYYAIN